MGCTMTMANDEVTLPKGTGRLYIIPVTGVGSKFKNSRDALKKPLLNRIDEEIPALSSINT